jgi:hypothetical protein
MIFMVNIMRYCSNLDCRITKSVAYDWKIAQFVPLTFDKYISVDAIHAKHIYQWVDFYTIKNNVIYGYHKYEDYFFTYDYISNSEIENYNCQEYLEHVTEDNFPHPLQFRSLDYWVTIYQNPLYFFLIKDRYSEEFLNSKWFEQYKNYETEIK